MRSFFRLSLAAAVVAAIGATAPSANADLPYYHRGPVYGPSVYNSGLPRYLPSYGGYQGYTGRGFVGYSGYGYSRYVGGQCGSIVVCGGGCAGVRPQLYAAYPLCRPAYSLPPVPPPKSPPPELLPDPAE